VALPLYAGRADLLLHLPLLWSASGGVAPTAIYFGDEVDQVETHFWRACETVSGDWALLVVLDSPVSLGHFYGICPGAELLVHGCQSGAEVGLEG
jgi:hypothetical protein